MQTPSSHLEYLNVYVSILCYLFNARYSQMKLKKTCARACKCQEYVFCSNLFAVIDSNTVLPSDVATSSTTLFGGNSKSLIPSFYPHMLASHHFRMKKEPNKNTPLTNIYRALSSTQVLRRHDLFCVYTIEAIVIQIVTRLS